MAHPKEVKHEYGFETVALDALQPAHAVILAVAHDEFRKLTPARLKGLMLEKPLLIDVKGLYSAQEIEAAGIRLWRL